MSLDKLTNGQSLGIIDYRNIISTIQEFYNMDFSNYAFTSFKRRLERVIQTNNLNSPNDLIAKIRDEESFFDSFLQDISVEETEMFRDPGLWRELRDNIIVRSNLGVDFRIWVADNTTGDELYTLLIVLREAGLTDAVKVIATSLTDKHLDKVKKGIFNLKKMETNIANYRRYKGKYQLTKYYTLRNNEAYMDQTLLDGVEFLKHNILKDKEPANTKLVLYRNKIIYFSKKLQTDVMRIICNSLVPGGIFVIGNKESLECCNMDKKYIIVNPAEAIYKKSFS